MKFHALVPFIVAATLVLSPAAARDTPPAVVIHVAETKKSETALRFSEEIRIFLPAPAGAVPGCEWQITSNDPRILRPVGAPKLATPADDAKIAEKTGAPVAPGGWMTTFFALRPGRSVVRLAFVRPAEGGEGTSVVTREINVVVN